MVHLSCAGQEPPFSAQQLLDWYGRAARELPWRSQPTPYRVWVSEIMLQQTRVEAVKPYFARFMEALPDIAALAGAREETLMKLWEGLGYYSRARNLQKAAKTMMESCGGEMPQSYEALLSLPGIGPYTAGAVASIAFGLPVPAVDGNVLRVLARVTADRRDISLPATKKAAGTLLASMIPADRPGDFNQAVMELGATVCVPNGPPRCGECPLAADCLAALSGNAMEYPVKQPKKGRRAEEKTVFLFLCGDRAAVRKRPGKGLLAGLWEFPSEDGFLNKGEAGAKAAAWGLPPVKITPLVQAKHIFTHIEWHMAGYIIWTQSRTDGFTWINREELQTRYPLPSAFSVYRKELLSLL